MNSFSSIPQWYRFSMHKFSFDHLQILLFRRISSFDYYKMQCSTCPINTFHIKSCLYLFQHIYIDWYICQSYNTYNIPNSIILPCSTHSIQSIFSHTISVQLAVCNILHVHNLNNLLTEMSWKMLSVYLFTCILSILYIWFNTRQCGGNIFHQNSLSIKENQIIRCYLCLPDFLFRGDLLHILFPSPPYNFVPFTLFHD